MLPVLVAATLGLLLLLSPPPAAAARPVDPLERAVVQRINDARAYVGLGRLRSDRRMARGATKHSVAMVRYRFFSHASVNGGSWSSRVARYARTQQVGEILGWIGGRRGRAARIVRAWLNSPTHRAVILSNSYRRIGVGWARRGRGPTYFTADFAR